MKKKSRPVPASHAQWTLTMPYSFYASSSSSSPSPSSKLQYTSSVPSTSNDRSIQPTIIVTFTLAFPFFIEVFFTFGEIFFLLIFLTFGLFFILNIFIITVLFGFFQFFNIIVFVLKFQLERKKLSLIMSSISRKRGGKADSR